MSYADYLRFLMGNPAPDADSKTVSKIRNNNLDFNVAFSNKLERLFRAESAAADGGITKPAPSKTGGGQLGSFRFGETSNSQTEPNATFRFISRCDPGGYDPEAILISTPTTIFVVFRGTDRVSCAEAGSFEYEWNEWLKTDFKFAKRNASVLNNRVKGQIHRGMAESLLFANFAGELAQSVAATLTNRVTKAQKKVWITGHSLGGAHAQLFAMYLSAHYNIKAQGLYIYESPHPGDQDFVNQLNETIGKKRIQRFEFGDDPICTLPPQAFGFARAGERNYYKDYSSPAVRSEQIPADDAKILCALGNLPGEQTASVAKFEFPPYCPGSTCFHHPTFVLEALRHELNASLLALLPTKVPLPIAGDNCNQGDLNKAENNNVINNTITAIEGVIGNLVKASEIMAMNVSGLAMEEGKYKLVCYAFKNHGKKYLAWDGKTGSQLRISRTGIVFNLTHKKSPLPGGYQLWKGGANMAADVKFLGPIPTGEEKSNNILMKTKDDIIGDEETWYLLRIPNTKTAFALYNWNTHKFLDAPDKCLQSSDDCPVNEFSAKDNYTQVWLLEKQ